MMNPSGAGIGQAAGELMKEIQKVQADVQKLEQQKTGGPNQAFQDALRNQQTAPIGNQLQVNQTQAATAAQNVLMQAKINTTSPSTRVGEAQKTENSKMATMLESLVNGQDKMTNIMNMALSGRQFNPAELLAMQAGVYRFSQELELTGKVVEKATSGIKQTMNTQV